MATAYIPDQQVIKGILDFLNAEIPPDAFSAWGIKKIDLEELKQKGFSMAIYSETGSYKDIATIAGDFRCTFRFRLDFKGDGDDEKSKLKLSAPLNYLARFCDDKTRQGQLGKIDIGDNRKPYEMTLEALPSKVQVNPDKTQVFSAFFNLKFYEERNLSNARR